MLHLSRGPMQPLHYRAVSWGSRHKQLGLPRAQPQRWLGPAVVPAHSQLCRVSITLKFWYGTFRGHTACIGKEKERAQHRGRGCRLGTRRADIDLLDDYRCSLRKQCACV